MKCNYVLYSRSFTKDYRWIINSPHFMKDEIRNLNLLYNSFDDYKNQIKYEVPLIYCINFTNCIFLFTFCKVNKKDFSGRDIYALQGISTPEKNKLIYLLPIFLINYRKYLNIVNQIGFDSCDNYTNKEIEFDFKIRDERPTINLDIDKLKTCDEGIELQFDPKGFEQLIGIMSNSHLIERPDFAFGATPETFTIFPSIQIFSKIFDYEIKREWQLESSDSNEDMRKKKDEHNHPGSIYFIDVSNRGIKLSKGMDSDISPSNQPKEEKQRYEIILVEDEKFLFGKRSYYYIIDHKKGKIIKKSKNFNDEVSKSYSLEKLSEYLSKLIK